MKATTEMLKKGGKVEGQDFKAPSECWVSLKLFPNNKNAATVAHYLGRFKVARKLMCRLARDCFHHAYHWNVTMKKK